jgi:hypothetical protein
MLWRKPHVAEMTAAARALYDDPEDAAAATILPTSAMGWDQVTDPPLRFDPWPYDNAELDRIRKTLPAPSASVAVEEVLFAARRFLHRNWLRKSREEPAKPDPRSELARIRDAADELLEAIKAASPLADRHLINNPSPAVVGQPLRPLGLLRWIERFKHDNSRALRALPERDAMGRPEKISEQRWVYTLRLAWEDAHALAPPERGWPSFRDACVEPLALARFRGLGAPWRNDRAWRNVLTEAKKHFEEEEKSPF